MLNVKLARQLRVAIAENDVQLKEVIRTTKISRTALYRILHDDNYDPKFSTIEKLAKHLKIDLNECLVEK